MSVKQPRGQDGRWWSRRWRQWLAERGIAAQAHAPGKGARIKRLEALPGRVSATLQPQAGDPCTVEIGIPTWTEDEWARALETLGHQALYTAHLLAGDLPPDLERGLAQAGVSLLPAPQEEIEQSCSCCARTNAPCEHVTAVYLALGDMLVDDPWLLLRLRGRDQQQVLRSLRMRRERDGEKTNGRSTPVQPDTALAPGERQGATALGAAEAPESLEADVARFWGSARAQEEFRPFIVAPAVELALLRRLGSPSFTTSNTDVYDTLAAIYRRVSREALALAYAADPDAAGQDSNGAPGAWR